MPEFLDPANYEVTAFALPWFVLGTVLLILGAAIFIRQRVSNVAVLLSVIFELVAVWFLAFGWMLSSETESIAEGLSRLALAAAALLPAVIYQFKVTVLRTQDHRREWLRVIWIGSILSSLIFATTDLFVVGVTQRVWGFYPVAGPGLFIFIVIFAIILLSTIGSYAGALREAEEKWRKRRVRDLLISFLIAYFSAVDFLPMYVESARPFSYLPILTFLLFAWGSIRRHRLSTITAARASREIIETMADALLVLDAEGRIRVVNEAVTKLLGFSPHDILGKSIDSLEYADGDKAISRSLSDVVERGAVRDQERLFRRKDGSAIDVSVSISPVRSGEMADGAVLIARDIGQRKRAEERLHAFARRLQQSNRELEDFAYVASHDLQEPLRKIQAFGDRLRSKEADTLSIEGVDYLTRMQSAAGRMQTLINDLLEFSRVTTKARPFGAVDLEEIAREVLHDLEIRIQEHSAAVTLKTLPIVDADPLQMRQLLQNLISNALKFMRPGEPPRIEIAGRLDGAHGEDVRCVVEVRDNGIGFDEKYADRIFTIFERLHGRGTYEGTGIGLAICRKIVERHGGTISATSAPGEGSTFTFVLPVRHSPEENIDAP